MIKLVIFDFDGVFTDGSVFIDNNNDIIKKYNIKDGTGISLLKKRNIEIGVISGFKENQSQINILNHLNISLKAFNIKNKVEIAKKWCKDLNLCIKNEVAFMGDDINDLDLLNEVYLSGCPSDCIQELKNVCDFKSSYSGGNGAIREFCEYILFLDEKKIVENKIKKQIKKEFYYQINHFKFESIEKVKEVIKFKKEKNIFFAGIGKSGNMANHCCDLMKSLSYSTFFLNVVNMTHGDLGMIKQNDIVIFFSNSGNTKELIEILHLVKKKNIFTIGICNTTKINRFRELCDFTLELPFVKEIDGNIEHIPTNSCMSQLLFINILISLLKENACIKEYKKNHVSGNIGKDLLTIKDVLITNYPKIIIDDKTKKIDLHDILLEMTNNGIGCCFFINTEKKLLGILTDGDIRRFILNNSESKFIEKEQINQNFYYETDKNKFVKDCKNYGYIPILSCIYEYDSETLDSSENKNKNKNKLVGIIKN